LLYKPIFDGTVRSKKESVLRAVGRDAIWRGPVAGRRFGEALDDEPGQLWPAPELDGVGVGGMLGQGPVSNYELVLINLFLVNLF